MVFSHGRCCKKCFLACSTTPATTYNYTRHHTPPHDNTQQHRKSLFKGFSGQITIFQTQLSAPGWPQDGPKMAQETSWDHFGLSQGPSWAIFGPSWSSLGPCWGHLTAANEINSKAQLYLEPSSGHLDLSLPLLCHLGPLFGHVGLSWDMRFHSPRFARFPFPC